MNYEALFDKIKEDRKLNTKQANELIAETLGRSSNTVKSYRSRNIPSNSLKLLLIQFK